MAYAKMTVRYDKDIDFNGYFNAHLHFVMQIEINDAKTSLHCVITQNTSSFDYGPRRGWGFINFAGLLWDGPVFSGITGFYPNGRVENWGEVQAACSRVSGGQIPNNVVYGMYASDDANVSSKGVVSTSASHDFQLSASNFDQDGNLKSFNICKSATRWYENADNQAHCASDYSTSIQIGAGTDTPVVSVYYPFAIKQPDWLSCNRPSGAVKRLDSDWKDVKNNKSDASQSKAFLKDEPDWKIAPKVGKE